MQDGCLLYVCSEVVGAGPGGRNRFKPTYIKNRTFSIKCFDVQLLERGHYYLNESM